MSYFACFWLLGVSCVLPCCVVAPPVLCCVRACLIVCVWSVKVCSVRRGSLLGISWPKCGEMCIGVRNGCYVSYFAFWWPLGVSCGLPCCVVVSSVVCCVRVCLIVCVWSTMVCLVRVRSFLGTPWPKWFVEFIGVRKGVAWVLSGCVDASMGSSVLWCFLVFIFVSVGCLWSCWLHCC